MYQIKLEIKDYAVLNVYTDSEQVRLKFMQPHTSITRTIPITNIVCSKIDRNNMNYVDAIIINDSNKKNMYYDKEYNVSILNANENEIRFPDIVYISLAMFSKILARKEKYLIHSSSLVHSNNNGFILVGDANSGKTSLAYELMSKHNCRLLSNDHSIIGIEEDKPMILGGTKEIQMRLGAMELYFPELYEKVNIKSEEKWNKKLVINDFINPTLIVEPSKDKTPLTSVFSISTSNSGNTFIKSKEKVDKFLFLYESASRIIKGTYNYITGLDYPMPSMEEEETLVQLSNLCKRITEECDVYEAKGSLQDVAKVLVKKV